MIAPPVVVEKKEEPKVVKHTLDLDEEEEFTFLEKSVIRKDKLSSPPQNINLIPTSEILKNMNVVYDEVRVNVEDEDDFIINSVNNQDEDYNEIEVLADEFEEEKQITLTFDLPISNETKKEPKKEEVVEKKVTFSLDDDDIKDIAVNDHVEVSAAKPNENGDIRYTLDDFSEVESSSNKKQTSSQEIVEEIEEDIVFERKVVQKEEVVKHSLPDEEEDIDPMNTPISELLKERAAERRRKMKDFNYKFNNAKIDDIEKVPAYKRQGVNLEDSKHSSDNDFSRTSIGLDDNDDLQVRRNNSFLHDNVD
ncbi:cell division protein FtsZ [Algibacter lectus]|uniref:Cell division protein FtsZ n=1 Tax=Algibacter lectus TaxID=221126 RepID=A0A090WV48_9FLAO|nr:cell division protein FtsZ [Algibacter lectus]